MYTLLRTLVVGMYPPVLRKWMIIKIYVVIFVDIISIVFSLMKSLIIAMLGRMDKQRWGKAKK